MRERKTRLFGYRKLEEKTCLTKVMGIGKVEETKKSHWTHFAQSTEMKDSLGMNQEFMETAIPPSPFLFLFFFVFWKGRYICIHRKPISIC